jgi:undecaprenyl-diphosphatase
MQVWEAVALGVVQGLTEFLPISSTGHLLVVRTWMGHPHPEDAFTTVIQLGTVVAVFAYFRADVARLLKALWDDVRAGRPGSTPDARQGWLIVLGTIPAVVVGFFLKPWLKTTFFNVPSVAVVAIVFALLMAASEWWRARRLARGTPDRPESDINWKDALFIGCFQCLALMPGGSRSGTTITAGLFAGLSRPAAARFSFLLSLPVVLGAGLKELYDEYKQFRHPDPNEPPSLFVSGDEVTTLIVGTVVSGVVGYLAIAWLLRFLQTNTMYGFVVYRLLLGFGILGLLLLSTILGS